MDTVASRLKFARQKRGWGQQQLADAAKIKYQSVQAVERGGGSKHLSAFARALNINLDWLEHGEGPMEAPQPVVSEKADTSSSEVELIGPTLPRDERDNIPLRAARDSGSGMELIVDDSPVDYRPRPPVLNTAAGGYSMWVSGRSMLPFVKPGQILHINPGAPLLPGDLVVIWKRDGTVLVKEYVRRTSDELVVAEYNGGVERKQIALRQKDVLSTHKVAGTDYP